ncbi:hypothetical protein PMAYCL1PPCAC_30368, partial [Pristionchus mayeri]
EYGDGTSSQIGAAWRHYTMKLDMLNCGEKQDDDEPEELELVACNSDGVLAMVTLDENEETCRHLRFVNLYTHCEISSILIPDSVFLLSAVDATTFVIISHRTSFEYFSQHREQKLIAMIVKSEDGFRNVTTTEVLLHSTPSHHMLLPHLYAEVLEGFVFAHGPRNLVNDVTVCFFFVSFAEICRSWATNENPKSFSSIPVSYNVKWRITVIPYDCTSFTILRGESGNNRIDVYDINSQSLHRSISVSWPLTTYFPPPIALPISFEGRRSALLQLVTGQKLLLDLTTGSVEEIPSFVSPRNKVIDISFLPMDLTPCERIAAGVNFPEVTVADAVCLPVGRTTISRSIIGGFVENLMDNYCGNHEVMTVLRLPIDKVHSLATLAADVVIDQLDRRFRMRITRELNPKNIPELIKAILQ